MSHQIFYDSEFTGLHQKTTLISLGLVSDTGAEFYAEFTDFDRQQCDSWIDQNVLVHTRWISDPSAKSDNFSEGHSTLIYGDTQQIAQHLRVWLGQFNSVEIWADCYAWDWVLLCELFGGAFQLPRQVFYMPFDLASLFRFKGLDADTKRAEFAQVSGLTQHNALDDARIIQACYLKLRDYRLDNISQK